MTRTVELPLWLALLIAFLAAWAALDRLMVPGVRWFIRQRALRVLEQVNDSLPIRIQPIRLARRQVLIDRLTSDPVVVEAAATEARDTRTPLEVTMARVERYAREIVPAFNAYLYFRLGYWLARRLARLLYRVRTGYTDEAGLAGIEPGATVVFVMNHRSNMDYVLVAYLAARRAALSYAVGEWARVWPLQQLVRSMGAYFIRRDSRNLLYRRVLERYVTMATAEGVTQAVYPEGGLSRDGALRPPRLGLINYMIREFDPTGPRDLVFVPVGINYDRTLEDRTLLLSLEGTPPASGLAAVRNTARFVAHNVWLAVRSRWHRLGYACVNFGTPVSMRRYCAAHGIDFRTMERQARFARVEVLGCELMAAVGSVVPVLPVALVSTVFTGEPTTPVSELELKARVHALVERLQAAGAHVYVPRRDLDYAVAVGLRMLTLRRVVLEEEGLFRANPAELRLLRYYANSIAHLHRGGRSPVPERAEPLAVPIV